MTTTAWAEQRRILSAKATARPGRYKVSLTPWVVGMHRALDDPAIMKIVCMKSAQVAWTDGVVLNYLGRRIDTAPCPMMILFSKEGAAKNFNSEKFEPMLEATPAIAEKIPAASKRDPDNRWNYKGFPGGFLKFVASNAPDSVKTTPCPVVVVEEPDDTNANVKGQGDSMTLLEERMKSYARRKFIVGGTPTVQDFSRIADIFEGSDQQKFFIACPHCDEPQVLAWEHVVWAEAAELSHEIYGTAALDSVRYRCPHCASLWTDAEKNLAVRHAEAKGHGWRATKPFTGTAGFYINELYSPFPGSRLVELLKKYLTAVYHQARGDDTKMRSFRNNTEGLPYAYKTDVPEASDLQARAESYAEFTVPAGGLLLSAGVDVQHDRVAVGVRAWGRGEESWLVFWGEIFGSTLVVGQGAWADLELFLDRAFAHESGAELFIQAETIDGSDGNRTEIVNDFVRMRRRKGKRSMSGKGASEREGHDKREIFATPRRPDLNKRNKPVRKGGIETHIVGTHRAKDLILETRVKLTGTGPGRMHQYAGVRADYWEQLTSEVKVPGKLNRSKKVWEKKASVRNEALDCEVLALHAARSLKTNLLHEQHWAALEQRLRQRPLLAEVPVAAPPPDEADDDESPPPAAQPAGPSPAPVQSPALPPPAPAAQASPKGKGSKRRRLSKVGGFNSSTW